MSDATSEGAGPSRGGRLGALLVAVAIGASAVGVLGWHLVSNRGEALDVSGFDLSASPAEPRTQAVPARTAPAEAPPPASSLGMLRADAGVSVAGESAPARTSATGAPQDAKRKAHADFAEATRKNERSIRAFAERMTSRYPVIRQYGRDWMSQPDLRKLNDDYMRDHDPVKFMLGLSRSENFSKLVRKYAGKPEIREFIVQGMKQAPTELTGAALGALQNDRVLKDLVKSVVAGVGLPPSLTALIDGGDASKIDQRQVMSEMLNNPALQKSVGSQGR